MCSLILLNVWFLVFLNWSLLTSGAAAVPKKGRAISPVVARVMLTRGKVIQFHIKANVVHVSLRHTVFITVMWTDMVLKSVTFIFIQLKHEKHYLPHLKNKINFIPSLQTHILICLLYKWSWWVWLLKATSYVLGHPDCLVTNRSGTPWPERGPTVRDKDLTWQFYSRATHRGLKQQKKGMRDCGRDLYCCCCLCGEKSVMLLLRKIKKLVFLSFFFFLLYYLRLARCGATCILTWLKMLTNQVCLCEGNVLICYYWKPFVLCLLFCLSKWRCLHFGLLNYFQLCCRVVRDVLLLSAV